MHRGQPQICTSTCFRVATAARDNTCGGAGPLCVLRVYNTLLASSRRLEVTQNLKVALIQALQGCGWGATAFAALQMTTHLFGPVDPLIMILESLRYATSLLSHWSGDVTTSRMAMVKRCTRHEPSTTGKRIETTLDLRGESMLREMLWR